MKDVKKAIEAVETPYDERRTTSNLKKVKILTNELAKIAEFIIKEQQLIMIS